MTAATARSAVLRQKLHYVRGHSFGGRAARFREQLSDSPAKTLRLDFASVATLPDWILASEAEQVRVGLSAAILKERQAIERELSGGRLASIAALVGADLFERLCDAILPEGLVNPGSGRLPRPEDFATIGAGLRRAALPTSLRGSDESEGESAEARLLCAIAARLIQPEDAGQ